MNINDELWFNAYYGIQKFRGKEYQEIDSKYTFDDYNNYHLQYYDGMIYGINKKGIFIADIDTKETEYLVSYDLDYTHKMQMVLGKNHIYFLVDDDLYEYNIISEDLKKFNNNNNWQIIRFIEDRDNKLIVAKSNKLEWYQEEEPTLIGDGGMYTNSFFDIAYDKYRDLTVSLGKSGDNMIIQTFDTDKWEPILVPYQYFQYNYPPNIVVTDYDLEVDFKGNYYVCMDDFFGIWNGENWEKISLIKNPDNHIEDQDEDYHVLCVDSSGAVWVSAYLTEYSDQLGKITRLNTIARMIDGEIEIIEENVAPNYVGFFLRGICLNNGVVVIDSRDDEFYYYKDGASEIIPMEDGDEQEPIAGTRYLCQNKDSDLVIAYNPANVIYSK
ncbi:MAG: hypothetical protein KAH48_06075, partial [Chlorobi bacterium]|nr:hypothetical protein [Chlorobiota bacterium]